MITRGMKMSNEEIKTMLETIKQELETKATNAKIEELVKQLKSLRRKMRTLFYLGRRSKPWRKKLIP